MGTLRNLKRGTLHVLGHHTLVGRSATAWIQIADRHVSSDHARLRWMKDGWELRDLGSRNGTFVDGDRLEPGVPKMLSAGCVIGFGHEDHMFELIDGGAPGALARSGDAVCTAVDGLLALPTHDEPLAVVYCDARGQWVMENAEGEVFPVEDGDVTTLGNQTWTLVIPGMDVGTATLDAGPTMDTVSLRFAVSRDEEHVTITVIHRGKETTLESREHAYVLLTLARLRLRDSADPLAEQGWVDRDQLQKMLGMDTNGLNVAIFRARGQLAAAGLAGAAGVVEVRRGRRRLGVEPGRVEVVPL